MQIDDSISSTPTEDRSACFQTMFTWQTQGVGVNQTSLYAQDGTFSNAGWTPDFKKLIGEVEVFATIPPLPVGDNYKLSEEIIYWVMHSGQITNVFVNQKENAGKKISLGKFTFDGTDATVNLHSVNPLSPVTNTYMIADTICFGECGASTPSDLTPPLIEDAKAKTADGSFHVEAKITDTGGIKSAFVIFNGHSYPMQAAGDIYSVTKPHASTAACCM